MLEITLRRRSPEIDVLADGVLSHSFRLDSISKIAVQLKQAGRGEARAGGQTLFRALFAADTLAHRRLRALPIAPALDSLILLVAEDAEVQGIPWEYALSGKDHLVLTHLFSRGLPTEQRQAAPPVVEADTLPVTIVACNPLVFPNRIPITRLKVSDEVATIVEAVKGASAPFRATILRPPTLDQLHKHLAQTSAPSILHFIGHGSMDASGVHLLFEDRAGIAQAVSADSIIRPVREKVWLVTLNACDTAATEVATHTNLAYQMAQAGVPYTVGLQAPIPDQMAGRFAEFLYSFLASNHPVEVAMWHARQAVARDESLAYGSTSEGQAAYFQDLAVGIPVLCSSLSGRGQTLKLEAGTPVVIDKTPRMMFDWQISEAADFRGRVQELADLGLLLERGYRTQAEWNDAFQRENRPPAGAPVIILRGEGGIGKSALGRRMAERFAWRFPAGVMAVALDDSSEWDTLPDRLGAWLLGDEFRKLPERDQQSRIVSALRGASGLLLLDNYETLLDAAEKGNGNARSLLQLIGRVTGGQTTLLLTSREAVSGLAGAVEVFVDGLDTESGRELFWDFSKNRRQELDESVAAQLVDRIGGHPLALELLGAAYSGSPMSLVAFFHALDSALTQVSDRHRSERQATLLSCFNYTFELLSEDRHSLEAKARNLYPRLTLFLAPFNADAVATVFQTPWADDILNTLFQKGFLRRTKSLNDSVLYFFHPMARWFAKSRLWIQGNKKSVEEKYGRRYARWLATIAKSACSSIEGKTDLQVEEIARLVLPEIGRSVTWLASTERYEQIVMAVDLETQFGSLRSAKRIVTTAIETGSWTKMQQLGLQLQLIDVHLQSGDQRNGSMLLDKVKADNPWLARRLLEKATTVATDDDIWVEMSRIARQMRNLGKSDIEAKIEAIEYSARAFENRGERVRAMDAHREALRWADQGGFLRKRIDVLKAMAMHCQVDEEYEAAFEYFEQAKSCAILVDDKREAIRLLQKMAEILRKQGNLAEGLTVIKTSLEYSSQTEDPFLEMTSQIDAGQIYVDMRAVDKAIDAFEQAVNLSELVDDPDWSKIARTMLAAAQEMKGFKQHDLSAFEAARAIHDGLGQNTRQIRNLLGQADIYAKIGEPQKHVERLKQALLLSGRISNTAEKADILFDIATRYEDLGELENALQIYSQALDSYLATDANVAMALTIQKMISLTTNIGGETRSVAYYARASDLLTEATGTQESIKTLLDFAKILHDPEMRSQAQPLIERLLANAYDNKLGTERVDALLSIAEVFRSAGELSTAQSCAELALEISNELGDRTRVIHARLEMADIALATSDRNAWLQAAETAFDAVLEANMIDRLSHASITMFVAADSLGESQRFKPHFDRLMRALKAEGVDIPLAKVLSGETNRRPEYARFDTKGVFKGWALSYLKQT